MKSSKDIRNKIGIFWYSSIYVSENGTSFEFFSKLRRHAEFDDVNVVDNTATSFERVHYN